MTKATSILLALNTAPSVWVDTLFDDGYYYLGVARHLSLGQGSTFALPFETNGYQPLWLLILTLVSFLVGGDRSLLVAGTHLTILLFVLCFIWIAGRQAGRQWPASLTVLCFSFSLLYGLEAILIPPIALLYFRADGWKRGILASLLFLTRLDTVGLLIGRELYEITVRKRFDVVSAAILGATALTYAGLNLLLFGTPVPVSGLAKAVGNVPAENWRVGVLLIIKAAPILAALALVSRAKMRLRNPLPIAACLIALGCSAIYYGIFSGWPIWDWYMWHRILLFYFVLLELIDCSPSIHRTAAMASIALTFFTVPFTHLDYFRAGATFGSENVRFADQVNASPLRRATFAMGDRAGSLGFFLDDRFKFIQTEGLVANLAFLEALKAGQGARFLDDSGVDFFIVDRGRYWLFRDAYAIPEPSQGLSARSGVMLLCFRRTAEVPSWSTGADRRIFRYPLRIACPSQAAAFLRSLQQQYRGVHANSRWAQPRMGFFDGLE